MTVEGFGAEYPSESHYVEWKAGIGGKAIQKAIVAFSNADGGVVILGVDDRGLPTGRPFNEGLEKKLWATINEIESPGAVEIMGLRVGSVELTVISVDRRRQGVAQTSDGAVVIRKGKQNLPLKGAELVGLVSQRVPEDFDSSPSRWPLAAADPALLAQLGSAFDIDLDLGRGDLADALEARGVATRRLGEVMLTKAGALFLAPGAEKQLGKCFVEVLRFPNDGGEYDLRRVFEGTPAQQVRAATEWIDEILGFDLVIVGLRRHELRRLPVRALRETIANAVAHRDYQLSGSAVEVRLTPRMLEVTSPGGFIPPVTSHNLHNAHAPRNRHIIGALRAFELAEDAGRGVKVIVDEMAADLRSRPTFEEHPQGHVTVRLPIESPVAPEERAWVIEQEGRGLLRPVDRRVLIEASRGVELTNASVRSLLDVDSHAARRGLHRLRDAGFLTQVGERGGARYRISPSIRRPAGFGAGRADFRSVILKMAHTGSVTNSMIRQRTGLARGEVSVLLRDLVDDGLLERRGNKRGSHYLATGPAAVDPR